MAGDLTPRRIGARRKLNMTPIRRRAGAFGIALFLSALALPVELAFSQDRSAVPPTGFALVSPERAAALRDLPASPGRAALLRAADRALTRSPHAMARVHVEGTLPGQGIYNESQEALRDLPAVRDLAIAFRLTGEPRYAEAAARFLSAWVETYRVSFNPIDETAFEHLFVAWDLLTETYRAPIASRFGEMLRDFSVGYLAHPLRGSTATNNWNSHRVKLIVLAAFALGDAGVIDQAYSAYVSQLRSNIREDGSTIDFAERDAINYVTYSLEPLAVAALAARHHGHDWMESEDGALRRGFSWLQPFADGTKIHEEFVRSTVSFDRTRAAAGLPGFSGTFDRMKTRLVMALAARLDPRFAPTARALRTEVWQNAWLELLHPIP